MEASEHLHPALSNLRIGGNSSKMCRLVVKRGQEHVIVKTEDIVLLYTDHKIVYVLDKTCTKYIFEGNLSYLEAQLEPSLFFRANRQYLVNIDYIKSYRTFEKVKLSIEFTIPVGEHRVIVSQENAPVFKRWIAGY